jgi:hypothetical protein
MAAPCTTPATCSPSGVFAGVTHSPPLEHAIELLIKAAEMGEPDDVKGCNGSGRHRAAGTRDADVMRRPSPPTLALTLADYPGAMVHIACPKCGRSGRLSKARLIAEHGADIPLPELRHVLAACPRRGQMHDPCEVVFPGLGVEHLAGPGSCAWFRFSKPPALIFLVALHDVVSANRRGIVRFALQIAVDHVAVEMQAHVVASRI